MPSISTRLRGVAIALAAALGLSMISVSAAADTPPPPPPSGQLALTGDVSVHDPTMAYDPASGLYIVASSHNSIRTAPTKNGPWTNVGNVSRAPWTTSVPNSTTLWAPHLQKIGDTFYYYYSQSSFGSSDSAIGVKTTKTPAIPSSYVDLGRPIIESGTLADVAPSIEYNAIDPAVIQDGEGAWWMVWGSFWDGIVVQQLGDDLVSVIGEPTLVASRRADNNPVEGPAILARDGYFYLFLSWDVCCAGATSTYKVAVGRSTSITGPYLDQNGRRLDEGGGTVVLDSRQSAPGVKPAGLYRAPGGADVYSENGTDYLVYHAYLPNNTLGIRPIDWRDGWPSFAEPGGGSYDHSDGSYVRLISEAKPFTMPTIGRVAGPSAAFGSAIQLNGSSPVSYVDMPDGLVSGLSGDFTISMWVKRGTTSSVQNWTRLFDFGDSTSNFMYLTPSSAAAPTGLRFDISTPAIGGSIPGSGNSVSVSTAWTHVAVTATGTTGTLWVNGQAVRTNTNFTARPADLGVTTNNWIGRSQFPADPGLNGAVDDFNIFSRALSQAEMQAMVASPGGGPAVGGGDVVWYRFDEAGGSTVTDSSASAKSATAVVPVTTGDQLQNPTRGTQCLTGTDAGVLQSACVEGSAAQTWKLQEAEGGTYRLANHGALDRKCLALADGTGAVGTAVTLAWCSASSALQRWSVEDTGHGFLRLSNPETGLAVEIRNVDGAIESDVVGAVRAIRPIANLAPPQQWMLEHVTATAPVLVPTLDEQSQIAGTAGVTTVTFTGSQLWETDRVTVGGAEVADFSVAEDGASLSFVAPAREGAGAAEGVDTTSAGDTLRSEITYVDASMRIAGDAVIEKDKNNNLKVSGLAKGDRVVFELESAGAVAPLGEGTVANNGGVYIAVVKPGSAVVSGEYTLRVVVNGVVLSSVPVTVS